MIKISIHDVVTISLALRYQIRTYANSVKMCMELGSDITYYVDNMRDLVRAYNAINNVPYTTDDEFILKLITKYHF